MYYILSWQQLNDPKYPISEKHRAHQIKERLELAAKVRRRELHAARRWNPIRKYSGQLY
jgi:hypothetical protein